MTNNCLCLICLKPNIIWLNFLSKFIKYDIYIIIDDNSINYKEIYIEYSNIQIIQIENDECELNGFINMNYLFGKKVTGWEKAIYYFSKINTNYDKIWFMEDDVFFYNEEVLLKIDIEHNNSDLLTSNYEERIVDNKISWYHWQNIDIKFPPPYYHAMVCATRISNILLEKIKDYADTYKTLFFLEALIPTICKKYNLKYDTPNELSTIHYNKIHNDKNINKNNLYHPVKDINKHLDYRNLLAQDS